MCKQIITSFIILSSLILIGAGCTNSNDSSPVESTDTQQPTPTALPLQGLSQSPTKNIVQPPAQDGTVREFTMVARQWVFEPSTITVNQGDKVKLIIKNIDVDHGLSIPGLGINQRLKAGQTTTVEFDTTKVGEFNFFCNVFCGQGHSDMSGKIIVK